MSVLSVTIFMFLQWPNGVSDYFQSLCTISALLYLCQGLSSNLKATLLVSYNFYTMHRAAGSQATSRRSGQVLGVALTVWAASLGLSALPLCAGLGRLRAHALGLSGRLLQLLRAAPLRCVHFGFRATSRPLGPAHSPVAVFRAAAETSRQLPGNFPRRFHSRDPCNWRESASCPQMMLQVRPHGALENAPRARTPCLDRVHP